MANDRHYEPDCYAVLPGHGLLLVRFVGFEVADYSGYQLPVSWPKASRQTKKADRKVHRKLGFFMAGSIPCG